jgi:precorrin-3B C17-methyltransferase
VIYIVGIGPGSPDLLTPQALAALARCQLVIGYDGYFHGLQNILAGKKCLRFLLGQEMKRAARAVEEAAHGHTVGVISSGDPGIYGMAGLVLEIAGDRPAAERPEVVVVPGVSAVNAAAALLGAPLGHDFAVISLSDLLTPWEVIEKRLACAAQADFVLALLNPRSRQRTHPFDRACTVLARYRAAETPVGLVRNAFRPEQSVALTTLAELQPASVDMFTTVFVGNSQTRRLHHHLVTPRGYRNE